MSILDNIKNEIESADCILIGIGEEFNIDINSENDLNDAYNKLAEMLGGKNYFIISVCNDKFILESNLDNKKIAMPVAEAESEENEMWDKYLLWLSCTLNKKLFVLELGVDLSKPQIIRWPFEKTVMLNNKAFMYRINSSLPNVPPEIKDKSDSVKENSINLLISN